MYYSHFGLNQAPFKITPNTEFFFAGGNRGPVLEALVYAVTHGEGIVKVTGEVGSGKTMLCHMLQARLPAHVDTVYIANPSVSPDEILRAIAFELQVPVGRDAPRIEVMQALQEVLVNRYAAGRRVVVFIEESQSMPLATLEEVRLLSNLETSSDKLLQIVLFGQPELDENLRQPNIRQLRERITHSFRLEPLAAPEIHEYLMFRLRTAGYRGPDLFPRGVVRRIAAASEGLSRRVNLIADKALLVAFSENTHTIKPRHIDAAVRDSEFSQRIARKPGVRFAWGVGWLVAGVALGITAYALVQQGRPAPQPVAIGGPGAMPSTYAEKEIVKTLAPAAPSAEARSRALSPVPPPPAAPAMTAPAHPVVAAPQVPAPPAPAAVLDQPPAAPQPKAWPSGNAATADMLQARIAATHDWLADQAPGTYSIQLLGSENAEQLRRHLNVIAKSIEINKIFVYRTVAKEKPSLTVLYGSFDDHGAAKEALRSLPASLKAYRPILRTVQGIQGEIKRHESSAQHGRPTS
ncbi:MAG: AAA family ATPase [Burkholderiales bacterium]|nr:AAA family ATPase [Burkholderiales bacterium]